MSTTANGPLEPGHAGVFVGPPEPLVPKRLSSVCLAALFLCVSMLFSWIQAAETGSNNESISKEKAKVSEKTAVSSHFIGEPLDVESQRELLAIARKCITAAVTGVKKPDIGKIDGQLAWKRGAFVTLEINGNLRGCIGHITDDIPIAEVVAEYAVLSAMNDTRFSPVTSEELPKIEISISAMSPIVEVKSHEDFKVGIHGILIKKNGRQAIFLPQVAVEQGWDKETTLKHLCMKAWLSPEAWKDPDCRFFVYTAQVFCERDFNK